MKNLLAALLLAGVSHAALAADGWHLDKVTITGSRSVPTDTLYGVIRERPGSVVTKDDIIADQDAITAALQKANVVGGIRTSLVNKPHNHVEVVFALTDNGVQAPTVTHVAPKLGHVVFTGNKLIDTDTLSAAAALKSGDTVTQQSLQDALNRMGDLYKKKNIGVSIQPNIVQPPGGAVDVTWTITEKKVPKEKKNTDDSGYSGQ